jgi:hypothetical protein
MGEALADQVIKAFGDNMDIDVVIPVSFFGWSVNQRSSDSCPRFLGPRYK